MLEQYMDTRAASRVADPGSLLEGLADWHPWLGELMGRRAAPSRTRKEWMGSAVDVRGTPVQIVELTGEPGDAVLCHPSMLHAASPNCLAEPRVMRRTNFRRRRGTTRSERSELSDGESRVNLPETSGL
jgi:hypothetical protein